MNAYEPVMNKFIETHVFDTGIDNPSTINVEIEVYAATEQEAGIAARNCRCSLVFIEGELGLYRDGDLYPLTLLDLTFDAIPESVRSRLGVPFDITAPGAVERAMQGLEDGSLVISEGDMQRVSFTWEQISTPEFSNLINRSDCIAYGVKPAHSIRSKDQEV